MYSIIGLCCGPLKHTYGAKYGTYMYSEIAATGAAYYYDNETHTAIGYQQQNSVDGWTEAGTWFSFNDKSAVQATTKFISKESSWSWVVFFIIFFVMSGPSHQILASVQVLLSAHLP